MSTRSLNSAESCDLGHTHFHLLFFSQIGKMSQTYFFELLPGNFTKFARNFAQSICGLLILQTILKLLK